MFSPTSSVETSLAGASLCLIPGTEEVGDLLAGILAEHNLIFERRGTALALVGPAEPARCVGLLRHLLTESQRRSVAVASIGPSGYPRQSSLDEWWRMQETSWFEQAMANPFGPADPESRGPAFTIWFQSVFNTSTRKAVAHECMARVHSVTRRSARQYSGAEIIDAAWLRRRERDLDDKLRQMAIQAIADRGGSGTFFINFLPHTIFEPSLCLNDTFAAMKRCRISPIRLTFEAVRAAENEHGHLRSIAARLRDEGCALSLDDLSTASGGLQLLRDLRPDYVKLAANLVGDVESPACASAIRRIVEVAEHCGTTVIAKNVADARTVENLWLLGVQFMQGHFFAHPAPTPHGPQADLLNLAAALEVPANLTFEYQT